jgi:hypothetical protein
MSVFHVYGPNITLVMAITLEIVVLLVICLAKSQNLLHFNNQDQRSGDGSSYCLAIVYYYSIMSVFDVYGPIYHYSYGHYIWELLSCSDICPTTLILVHQMAITRLILGHKAQCWWYYLG